MKETGFKVDVWAGELHQKHHASETFDSWNEACDYMENNIETGFLCNVFHTDFIAPQSRVEEVSEALAAEHSAIRSPDSDHDICGQCGEQKGASDELRFSNARHNVTRHTLLLRDTQRIQLKAALKQYQKDTPEEMLTGYTYLEMKVLQEVPASDADFLVTSKMVSENTDIPLDVCRAILRELRKQNKVVVINGYNIDECQVHGSGYMRAK